MAIKLEGGGGLGPRPSREELFFAASLPSPNEGHIGMEKKSWILKRGKKNRVRQKRGRRKRKRDKKR